MSTYDDSRRVIERVAEQAFKIGVAWGRKYPDGDPDPSEITPTITTDQSGEFQFGISGAEHPGGEQ